MNLLSTFIGRFKNYRNLPIASMAWYITGVFIPGGAYISGHILDRLRSHILSYAHVSVARSSNNSPLRGLHNSFAVYVTLQQIIGSPYYSLALKITIPVVHKLC